MNGKDVNDQRVKVEIAGQPKEPKGPQPNDECRLCGRKGHWYISTYHRKNDCPDLRRDRFAINNIEKDDIVEADLQVHHLQVHHLQV